MPKSTSHNGRVPGQTGWPQGAFENEFLAGVRKTWVNTWEAANEVAEGFTDPWRGAVVALARLESRDYMGF